LTGDVSSINEYWLKAFKNSDVLKEEIKEKDEEVLKFVKKVNVKRE